MASSCGYSRPNFLVFIQKDNAVRNRIDDSADRISFFLDIPGIRCFKPISQHGPQSQPGIIRIKKGDEGLRLNLMFDFR